MKKAAICLLFFFYPGFSQSQEQFTGEEQVVALQQMLSQSENEKLELIMSLNRLRSENERLKNSTTKPKSSPTQSDPANK